MAEKDTRTQKIEGAFLQASNALSELTAVLCGAKPIVNQAEVQMVETLREGLKRFGWLYGIEVARRPFPSTVLFVRERRLK
jgi:hypothetical protein